ncbi:MAG TPA: hypothetical protein VFQ61_20690 [Polyangiaceae bacterium]|nr:hypothetical protein [Polyangiaceae bacterium]
MTWYYRTHGAGVDIDRGVVCGGIDFDFDKIEPDPWRLRIFVEKQVNAGTLNAEYAELVQDEDRFDAAARELLG